MTGYKLTGFSFCMSKWERVNPPYSIGGRWYCVYMRLYCILSCKLYEIHNFYRQLIR